MLYPLCILIFALPLRTSSVWERQKARLDDLLKLDPSLAPTFLRCLGSSLSAASSVEVELCIADRRGLRSRERFEEMQVRKAGEVRASAKMGWRAGESAACTAYSRAASFSGTALRRRSDGDDVGWHLGRDVGDELHRGGEGQLGLAQPSSARTGRTHVARRVLRSRRRGARAKRQLHSRRAARGGEALDARRCPVGSARRVSELHLVGAR